MRRGRGRPPGRNPETAAIVTVRVSKELAADLAALAGDAGMSISTFARLLIKAQLEQRHEAAPEPLDFPTGTEGSTAA